MSNLFIPMLFFNSHFLQLHYLICKLYIITVNLINLFIPMLFPILNFSNYITLFVYYYCELEQSVYSNAVSQLSLHLTTSSYLYNITLNLINLVIPMLFSILNFSNYITLFVCYYCELEQSVYSDVVFQFSISQITLPYLYIITVNLRNLFIPILFFNSQFL